MHKTLEDMLADVRKAEAMRVFYPFEELTPEELDRWLDGDTSLFPDDCGSVCVTGLTDAQFKRFLVRGLPGG